MKKEENIDNGILKNYVEAINSIKEPMSQMKQYLKNFIPEKAQKYI